jgi:probable addiction module antidote protein
MSETFTRFDAAEYLRSEDDIQAYLEAAQEEAGDDPAFLALVLSDIARARGMSSLAKEVGMTRAGLYKALSPGGNPRMSTVHKVAKALNLKITVQAAG